MKDFTLPDYTLYFDTNAAFSSKPNEPMSGGFLQALAQLRELTPVVVKVPDVVRQEIWYQKTEVALQALEKQANSAETLKSISGINPPKAPYPRAVKEGVKKRIDQCLAKHLIEVVHAPIQKIDWQQIVESACWRVPPFEKSKQGDKTEKGFRDCLIVESIVYDAETLKGGHIAVISGDKMFARGFANRAARIARPHKVYEACTKLISELRVSREAKSSEFASLVMEKVAGVFYTSDEPNCVVFAHNVIERLRQSHEEELSQPTFLSMFKPETKSYGDWLSQIAEWIPISDMKINATPPEFVEIGSDGRYHWKSELTLTRLLRRKHPAGKQTFNLPDERIRIKKVDVLWSAEVNPTNAEFSKTSIDELQPALGDDFVDATWELRTKFDFPLLAGLDPEPLSP